MSDDEWGIDMTPEEGDVFVAAVREARRGPDQPDPLATLRADVEALRAVIAAAHRDSGADAAYATVLDLIDKHREQQ